MAAAAEENEAIRDIFTSAYTHPMPIAVIHENDTKKNQQIIAMDYRSLGKKILSDFKDYITAVS